MDFEDNWIDFLPYQTFYNLLSRCFISHECYHVYINNEHIKDSEGSDETGGFMKTDSDILINELIDITINSFQNIIGADIPIRHGIYFIKILIALTPTKNFSTCCLDLRNFSMKIFRNTL
ncbi:hypothetical protein RF11_06480 [Thelohanellus kitauei]|uniref:Uncharacterized protein n=1 Tax=Thelohanellus kitauei TaxID=669202 RepID=A0A0C2N586_THEKT|nr:hypothetical protein RF11_06480 [Thelohanellus kitauei]